jgi:hypothetical protein
MNKQIKISGIARNVPQNSSPDGSCQEIINMRYRSGAWRPSPDKRVIHNATFTYQGSPIVFDSIFLHDIEDGVNVGDPNWLGLCKSMSGVFLINPNTNVCELIDYITIGDHTTCVFLKRTMIVTASDGLKTYLYSKKDGKGSYGKIGNLPTPMVNLYSEEGIKPTNYTETIKDTVDTEGLDYHDVTGLLGLYYKAINDQSHSKGRLHGSICYRTAFKLFDGSYVMHSIPRYLECNNGVLPVFNNDNMHWRLTFGSVVGQLITSVYPSVTYDSMKDLIDSIVVFATKVQPKYLVDDTITPEFLASTLSLFGDNWTAFPINPDFENMCDSEGWYQILEFDFNDVVGNTEGSITKLADTKNFYQDYATRKTLTTDQFSHHQLVSKSALVYNDRLHILNVKTRFETPTFLAEDFHNYAFLLNRQGVVVVYLSTGLGKAVLVNQCAFPVYQSMIDSQYYYVQNAIVGYPDARATKMEVAVVDGNGQYRLLYSVDLKANVGGNFSYHQNTLREGTTTPDQAHYVTRMVWENALGPVYTIPQSSDTPFDTNRLQASEIQNPMVYPSKYSYQIGTGEGICMAVASEPLTAGQFGAFPLMVFTSKGRWVLQQGSDTILYASVQNVDAEVCDNPKNVIGIGSSIVYSTLRGLYIAQGMEKKRISELVEGKPHSSFNSLTEMQTLLSDSRCTPSLANSLSDVDFLEYLSGSSVGFDQVTKEMIVTNPAKGYSYVYSTEYDVWFKISRSFDLLINNYPLLYGISEDKVYNLSDQGYSGNTQVMVISNAMSLEMPDVFKKIERMIVRCSVSTAIGSFVGAYIFATDDLYTYELVTGRQRNNAVGGGASNGVMPPMKDLLLQRSQGSAKYFSLVINGNINNDSEISFVDSLFIEKMNRKIR